MRRSRGARPHTRSPPRGRARSPRRARAVAAPAATRSRVAPYVVDPGRFPPQLVAAYHGGTAVVRDGRIRAPLPVDLDLLRKLSRRNGDAHPVWSGMPRSGPRCTVSGGVRVRRQAGGHTRAPPTEPTTTTHQEDTAWPLSPCASSSRAASTSGTRPDAGTP